MRTMNFSLTLPISLWFILLFINRPGNAAAPTTEAVCQDSFGWMSNSKGQSPCLVSAYLEGACGTGYWNIPALPAGNSYNGPNENQTNLCLCSSVVYNGVSACGACQGQAWITWSVWKFSCDPTIVTVANYKFDIPPGTAIPRWMYQDPTQQSGVSFNNTLAYAVASQGLPDVTSSGSALPSGSSSGALPSSTSAGGKSANTGAIVGGVIGGIGLLTAFAILGWWFLRRRHGTRSSQAPSKQYIAKWSKEVPAGQAPSRYGGTSYGSDSIAGDGPKEREMMMSPTSTVQAGYPYGVDANLAYANGNAYEGQQKRSLETVHPQQPVAYYPSSPPSAYPGKRSRTQGHKKDHSGSSSFSRKLMGIPAAADNITPFYLPPVETIVTSDPEMSLSPSDGRASVTNSEPSSRSRSTKPSRKQKSPVVSEPLPSTIEYYQSLPPPLPNTTATASMATNVPLATSYGRPSNEGNRSRSSFTGSRPGYYNPDDPSTYPTQMDPYGRPPSSRQTSSDQLPAPIQIPQPAWPDAVAEKAALASRDYSPQTMPTPGHSGYGTSQGHQTRAMPSPPMSPYRDSPTQIPQPTQPLVGASLGLTNSIHTLQGFEDADLDAERAPIRAAPSGPAPEHQRQDSFEAEGPGAGNGFFSSFGRRVRPGGRSNESNNSQQAQPAPGRQWSIHVRNSQVGPEDFNPYRT